MAAVQTPLSRILKSDLDAIGDLLTRGFQHRSRGYWMRGLQYQGGRRLPPGAPRYGYLIENHGAPVGCLLMIYSSKVTDSEIATRCNVSSWYLDPEFRNYAALFASLWRDCPASTARRAAANITRARTNHASAIWPTRNWPSTACEPNPTIELSRPRCAHSWRHRSGDRYRMPDP